MWILIRTKSVFLIKFLYMFAFVKLTSKYIFLKLLTFLEDEYYKFVTNITDSLKILTKFKTIYFFNMCYSIIFIINKNITVYYALQIWSPVSQGPWNSELYSWEERDNQYVACYQDLYRKTSHSELQYQNLLCIKYMHGFTSLTKSNPH